MSLCGLAVVAAAWTGCKGGGEQPPEVLASPLAAGERPGLTDADAVRVISALETAAGDARPVARPVAARYGRRWSDVPAAASRAAEEIEGAVFRRIELDDGYRFEIRTIDGRPVELRVRRVDGAQVYAATATVGRFDDDPATREKLLIAFDEALVALGKKRKFDE